MNSFQKFKSFQLTDMNHTFSAQNVHGKFLWRQIFYKIQDSIYITKFKQVINKNFLPSHYLLCLGSLAEFPKNELLCFRIFTNRGKIPRNPVVSSPALKSILVGINNSNKEWLKAVAIYPYLQIELDITSQNFVQFNQAPVAKWLVNMTVKCTSYKEKQT